MRRARPLVAVVDDEPGVLAALARMLQSEPCEVRTTSSPWELLEWVREGGVDVVLSDHSMPGMPGTELLQRVEDISPETRGVMITAHRGRVGLHPGGRRAVRRIVEKPWNDAELKGLIHGLLERGSPG